MTLNFAGLSTSAYGGSGFSTAVKVVVQGATTGTGTVTLSNPGSLTSGRSRTVSGGRAMARLGIPRSVWAGATQLTVTVTPVTPGNWVAMNKDALLIGYASF